MFLYRRVQKGVGEGGQRGLSRGKIHFFIVEKHVEDVKQNEKNVPDLVESIMRPADPVKEELRKILMKTTQFRFKVEELRVCTFWMLGRMTDFCQRLPAGAK